MPVTLVVKRRGEPELPPVSFDGPRIVIGRGGSCELRVPDASVSARHASIRASGAHWTIVDEGSTNGTRLNGEKLGAQSPRPLKTGDVLGLGRVEIAVKLGAAPTSSQNATRELALQLVARSLGDAATGAAVVVREGPDVGARMELARGEPRTIGRDPRCALRLTDPAVPPMAVEVTLEGGRARATVRDGRAKARLGDRALEERETFGWGDGALLFVGGTTLVLDDAVARALDASAHGDDEKMTPESLAPPPLEPEPIAPPPPVVEQPPPPPPKPQRPPYDRRRSWRGATVAFEVIAVILALIVLGGSIAGLYWLLKK